MASIRKRGSTWQVRVSRKGFAPQVKSFLSKSDAERWGRKVEEEMDRGGFISRLEAERVTLSEIIDRYMREVTPTKRGAHDECIRLNAMKRHKLVRLSMAALSPSDVADYRNDRLKGCGAATVLRDLAML